MCMVPNRPGGRAGRRRVPATRRGGDRLSGCPWRSPIWWAGLVTPEVLGAIHDLADLAPLHNPIDLAIIEAASSRAPGVPGSRCSIRSSTNLAKVAWHYALPDHVGAAPTFGVMASTASPTATLPSDCSSACNAERGEPVHPLPPERRRQHLCHARRPER